MSSSELQIIVRNDGVALNEVATVTIQVKLDPAPCRCAPYDTAELSNNVSIEAHKLVLLAKWMVSGKTEHDLSAVEFDVLAYGFVLFRDFTEGRTESMALVSERIG